MTEINNIRKQYQLNKSAKVGDICVCPSCSTEFKKTNYQQAFCKTKSKSICKDKYWNTVDPKKRNNTTRISPASAMYMQKQALQRGFPNHETRKNYVDDYDGSWDAHSCYVANCEWCLMKPEFCRCD